METTDLNKRVKRATRWSAITEIAARVIAPITAMVLARLLTPEAFGVVTTLTMIISFAELFTDAGFQKYLIQHEFIDLEDREQSTNVAFWSNFGLSILIWGVIAIFADPLAALVGNPGLGHVLTIACISIPLAAFSSIQTALYRRDLDFKTLFKVRITAILIPLIITIPLALWLRSYWALVIGTIIQNSVNAILLTVFSSWKPKLYYSWRKLKEMLSFTIWSLIEAVSIWLTSYIDVFIVGTMLNQHYLGLYKTSSTIVGQIMGLITATTTPILFSSLSRLQNNDTEFQRMFFKFQKYVGMLVIPVGVGIFCYSDFITNILLGNQWMAASGFIGLWGLMSAIAIVFSHYCSEIYRAKGMPKLSVLAQWLHIIVLWPGILIAIKYGFEVLYVARSLLRLELVFVNLCITYIFIHISPVMMLKNILPSIIATAIMCITSYLLNLHAETIWWQCMSILVCIFTYIVIIVLFKEERMLIRLYFFKFRR